MREPSKIQRQAITHNRGPALVCAGPGSGKTFTVIQRILYLINHYHVQSDKILVITYTKAAAKEMKERFEAESTYTGVYFGTFHSICYNILKQSGKAAENSLISEGDKRKLLHIILNNLGMASKSGYEFLTVLQNRISKMKNITECIRESPEFSYEEIRNIKEEYDRYLREQKLLDFDDMIVECLKLLNENEVVRRKYQQMFQYILVDEFQDINQFQYDVVKLLAAPENNIFAVGDDDQTIYGFRGAYPDIMQQFVTDFPEGIQIMLTENYRSKGEIIRLAEKMISQNQNRFIKEFHPIKNGGKIILSCFETRKEEELRMIKELSLSGLEELYHTAVLVRTNREGIQYKELFKAEGIPVQGKNVSQEDIFHSFIMEDIAAFLSYLFCGKKRCDFIRFMNKPNRFLARAALPHEEVRQEDMEQYYVRNQEMGQVVRLFFHQLGIAEKLAPVMAITFFRKTLGYDSYLQHGAKDYREFERLCRQADQIQKSFTTYKAGMPVGNFIKLLKEKSNSGPPEETEEKGLHILTMHSAKGLEFDRVYLPDVNEGIIPGREIKTEKEHEEERRLLYVAITRAKNDLYLYYTKERNRKISRYLEGIIPHP